MKKRSREWSGMLAANIILQMALYIALWFFGGAEKERIIVFFAFADQIIFYICLNERGRQYFKRGNISFLMSAFYFLLEPLVYSHTRDIYLVRYFFLYLFVASYMEILLEGRRDLTPFRLFAWAYFLGIFLLERVYAFDAHHLYVASLVILCGFPTVFYLLNLKDIHRHTLYSLKIIPMMSLFLMIYLIFYHMRGGFLRSPQVFGEMAMIPPLIVLLIFLMIKGSKPDGKQVLSLVKIHTITFFIAFISILLVKGDMTDYRASAIQGLQLSFIFLMIRSYGIYFGLIKNKSGTLREIGKESKLLDEYDQLYVQKTNRFLHDDVLQDIILAQKLIQRAGFFDEKEQIERVLKSSIRTIREEINLNDPLLDYGDNLSDHYYRLINELQAKYDKKDILIDFNCPEDLVLPSPYDRAVYKIIGELISNLFKHSRGFYSAMNLRAEKGAVRLRMKNMGDSLEAENDGGNHIGLKLITMEVRKLDGEFNISEEKEGEEPVLAFYVDIPISKERIYEDFVNRRS